MGSLTDEQWDNWEKQGKQEYVSKMKGFFGEESSNLFSNSHHSDIVRMLYDLVWRAVEGKLKRDELVSCVGELIAVNMEISSLLIDVITIIDTQTQIAEDKKEERLRLQCIVRDIGRHVPDSLIKERLEFDFLGESSIVKNPKKFFTAVIKLKTKLFYKQHKFNLFHEESEGFAKLVTELMQDLTSVTPEYITKVIQSLIGFFNLDPNRVLDIILECFEAKHDQLELFIAVLKEYHPNKDTMKDLLNFKFSQYISTSSEDETPETPKSLYMLTALLIQYEIVKLEDIIVMLSPSFESIENAAKEEMAEARQFVRRMNVVSMKQSEDGDQKDDEASKDLTSNNQKIGLLAALFKCGAWKIGLEMLRLLPESYCVSQPEVADSIIRLLHITIDPVYHKHCGLTKRIKPKTHSPLKNITAPPQAQTIEEMEAFVYPMLQTLGPFTHRDPTLLFKVLRILKSGLGIKVTQNYDEKIKVMDFTANPIYFKAITLLDEVLLPSLSLLKSNCCLAEEIWSLIRHFPYEHRWRLYHQWKTNTDTEHPVLLREEAAMFQIFKKIVQRVSKENAKQIGRQLGKLTHSSPGIIFHHMLLQIQLNDALIGPIVDALRYLNNLSFDVLGYCIIESLNDPGQHRSKTDGTSVSKWLVNMAMFCGSAYKKYNIELTGLLQYVANQLKSEESLDLIILKEIVTRMGGIQAAVNMTGDQLEAMAGGELLRQEASSFHQVKNTRKSSQRLKDCLIEMELAVPLVLLMAQQENYIVFQENDDSNLKLVGLLVDQCHDTLVQFGMFLSNNLSQDDYTQVMPPLHQLLSEFHVNPDIAFFLARPMFSHYITTKFEENRKADKNWKQKSIQEKQEVYAESAREVMEPLASAIAPAYPAKIWDDISPSFFATYWSLSMYDLHVPEQQYTNKMHELKEALHRLPDNRDFTGAKRKKESERLHTLMEKLQEEEKRHKEHVDRVMARLKKEKETWFISRTAKTAKNETVTQILQHCIFPRSIFTASDAIFTAKFVSTIHMLKTPNFSTLICLDRTFCDITYTVTCCTESEASNYGRFLCAMLETVMRWHKDKDTFQAECSGYPGFITKFRGTEKVPEKSDADTVDFENYRHVCHKWHYKIAKALVVCLDSKDYVQIRNALIVLTEIISIYPLISNLSYVLEKRVAKVCEEEKKQRYDLYIKARSYHGALSMHKSRMIREENFHQMKGKKPEEAQKGGQEKDAAEEKDEKEEGEISTKDKKSSGRGHDESDGKDRDSKSESRERKSESRDRKSESRDRKSESRDRKSESRDRKSESRDRKSSSRDHRSESRTGEMGPPAARTSLDNDSDRDFKRKRDPEREKEREKSPVLDRLERKEKLRKEKEKLKKEKEEEARKDRKKDKDEVALESEKRKRKDDSSGSKARRKDEDVTKPKKAKEDDTSSSKTKRKLADDGKQNGDTVKRKSRR